MEKRCCSVSRAYLFDYGGTLDTGGQHWGRFMWTAYREAAVPVTEQAYRDAYVETERQLGREPIIGPGFTFRETLSTKLRLQLQRLGCPDYHDRLLQQLYGRVQQQLSVSRTVLCKLGEGSTLALVSNFYGNIQAILRDFRLEYFQAVVESAVVGIRKPDPRIFQLGVDALGMNSHEVLVVGDSFSKDILPASSIGCPTAWIRGKGWADENVDEALPTTILGSITQLETWLQTAG